LLKLLKQVLLPAVALLLIVVPVAGCAGSGSAAPPAKDPATFTDQEVRDIVAAAVNNVATASSFTGNLFTAADYSSRADSGLQPTTSSLNATMTADRANGRAEIKLGITVSSSDMGGALQALDADTYLYSDYLYVTMTDLADNQWFKLPVTDTVLEVFSARVIDNEVAMYDKPAEVHYVRNETYNGADCYVISVVPNDGELLKNAQRQQPQGVDVDWSQVTDISQLYEDDTYLVWIETATGRLVKAQNQVTTNFGSVPAFASDPVLSGIYMTSSGVVTLSNYNQKVTINLPEAAQQAIEVSPDNLVS
jgi:hypothetical protein